MSLVKTLMQSPSDASADVSADVPNQTPSALPAVPTASWEAVRKLKELNPHVDYRPYPNAPKYIIGADGSIWSNQNSRGNTRDNPLKMNPSLRGSNGNRYLGVVIRLNGTKKTKTIHVMVLETFISPRPPMKQAAHNNGVHEDNRLENLRWATHSENMSDRTKHGKDTCGERHGCAKLTEKEVIEIRKRLKNGCRAKIISKEYGVHPQTISRIGRGDRWRNTKHTTAADFTDKEDKNT